MAERIGLEAYLSLASFRSGFNDYVGMIDRMNSRTGSAAGSMASKFNRLGTGVLKTGAMMATAGVAGATALAGAIGGVIVKSSNMAADMQAQVSGIVAIMDTDLRRAGISSSQAVDMLNDAILDLSIDPNLKVDASQAADAIGMLARNGLGMAEIMDGAARNTVLLANATGAEFGTAADIATDTMALFNVRAADMGQAVNQISAVVNNSKFSIDDFRLALAQGGGVASAFGVELEDFTTSIAAIAPAFASGSDAGTSFKTMLQRLIPTTNPAQEAMTKLGLLTKDGLTNAFYDANGQMKDMGEISSILYKSMSGLTEEQRSLALSTIFGADALRAANELMKQGEVLYTDQAVAAEDLGVAYDELNGIIEGGITRYEALQVTMGQADAERAAATRVNNLAGVMEILRGVVDAVMLQIGNAFLPMWEKVGKTLIDFVNQSGPAIVGFFSGIAQWMAARLPGAIENLTGKLTTAITFFQNFFKGLQFASALGAGAVESAVTGIGLALIRMVPAEYKRNVNEVFKGITEIARVIDSSLSTAVSFAQEHMDEFRGALAGIGLVLAGAAIASGIAATAAAIAALVNPITAVIVAAGVLGAAWAGNWGGIRQHTANAWATVQPVLQSIGQSLQKVGTIARNIGRSLGDMWTAFRAGDSGGFSAAFEGLKTAFQEAADFGQAQFSAFVTGLSGTLQKIAINVKDFDWSQFITPLTDWGTWIASLDWSSIITTVIDWATWIPALSWNNIVQKIDWATYIAAFSWKTVIPTLVDWGTYIASLDWGTYITNTVDWATYIGEFAWSSFVDKLSWPAIATVDWATYIPNVDWSGVITSLSAWSTYIVTLDWSAYITSLDWSGVITTFDSWGDYIASLDWSGAITTFDSWGDYIASLDWTTIITTAIDWGTWIPALVWNTFVTAIDLSTLTGALLWSEFISEIDWGSFITATLDFATYVSDLDWGTYITNTVDWATYIGEFAWSSYVDKLQWPIIAEFAWDNWITALSWPVIPAFSWHSWINKLSWPDMTFSWGDWVDSLVWPDVSFSWGDWVDSLEWPDVSFSWSDWVDSLEWPDVSFSWGDWVDSLEWPDLSFDWGRFIPDFSWPSIPSFPGWRALVGNLNPFGRSARASSAGSVTRAGGGIAPDGTARTAAAALAGLSSEFSNLLGRMVLDPAQDRLTKAQEAFRLADETLQRRRDKFGFYSEEAANAAGLYRSALEELNKAKQEVVSAEHKQARSRQAQQQIAFYEQQAALLDTIAEHGLDAQKILDPISRFGEHASMKELMLASSLATEAIAKQMEAELKLQAATLKERMEAAKLQKEIAQQVDAFTTSQEEFQAVYATLEGINSAASDAANSQVLASIAQQIQQAGDSAAYFIEQYKQTGDRKFYEKALAFEADRRDLIRQYGEELDRVNRIAGTQQQTKMMENRLAMLKRARELGIDLDLLGGAINSTAAADLVKLADHIAAAEYEAAKFQERIFLMTKDLKTDFQIGGIAGDAFKRYKAEVLDPLWAVMTDINATEGQRLSAMMQYRQEQERITALEKEQERAGLLESRVKLLQRARELGVDLSDQIGMNGNVSGSTLFSLADRIAKAETELAKFNEQLFWTTNGLKQDLPYQGLGSGLVDRYKREVLDPIWAKIHDIKTTEGERYQLVQKYRAEQEKILQLQEKQSKLDFLKEQMDLVKLVNDNGLDAGNIFGGLTLGVNAEIDDLLAAISRAISQMIAKTEGELGIHSPSTVMHRIGRFAMIGLTNGIKEASQGAIQAAQRVTTGLVAGTVTTSRNVSVTMGGVNIYNGMDQAMFDAQVRQTVRRAL